MNEDKKKKKKDALGEKERPKNLPFLFWKNYSF